MEFGTFRRLMIHLPSSLFFNFYYLPFRQAIKIPILFFSKVYYRNLRGKVILNGKVSTGMVLIGEHSNSLYQHSAKGIVWDNKGGICIFGHRNSFCTGLAIEIGKNGCLKFEDDIYCGPMVRIACFDSITVGKHTRIAWECIILDTDFHHTIDKNTNRKNSITKPINLGCNNWIGMRSILLKGTVTPDFCIASAYSLLNKRYDIPNYSLLGGIPAKFIRDNIYRDLSSHVE